MVSGEDIENKLVRILDRMDSLQAGFDEGADGIRDEVREAMDYARAGDAVSKAEARRQGLLLRNAEQVEMAIERLARPGVNRVQIVRGEDGQIRVIIGEGNRFEMPRTLRTLLAVLCLHNGSSDDSFVGFKTWEQIQREMEKRLGKQVSKHAIESNICRLCRWLLENLEPLGGANPYLVETKRGKGARFKLRKDGHLQVQNVEV